MTNENQYNDAIDLVQLTTVLLKKKWLIIAGTILFTIAAAIASFLLPKTYESEGFMQLSTGMELDVQSLKDMQNKLITDLANDFVTSSTLQRNRVLKESLRTSNLMLQNVSIPDFRKYRSQFSNLPQFNQYLTTQIKDKQLLKELVRSFNSSEEMGECIQPVYAYSKTDMKELVKAPRDLKNYVLGVSLICPQSTPEASRTLTDQLGRFIKDRLILGKLSFTVEEQLGIFKAQYKQREVDILEGEFSLKQLKGKRTRITQVMKKYPQSNKNAGRELVSLENHGHRYLSPVSQLVGIESYISDIMTELANNRRVKEMAEFKITYLEKVKEQMTKTTTVGELLPQMQTILNELTETMTEIEEDARNQAKNEMAMEVETFTALEKNIRFAPEPNLPNRPASPRKGIIIAVALVFGFFFFVFFAFFTDWWQSNKKKLE